MSPPSRWIRAGDTDQPDIEVSHDSWGWGTIQCLGTNEHELPLAVRSKCPEQEPRAGGATHVYLSLSPGGAGHMTAGAVYSMLGAQVLSGSEAVV